MKIVWYQLLALTSLFGIFGMAWALDVYEVVTSHGLFYFMGTISGVAYVLFMCLAWHE